MLLRYGADPNHAVPATDSGTVVQCSRCGRTQAAGNLKVLHTHVLARVFRSAAVAAPGLPERR